MDVFGVIERLKKSDLNVASEVFGENIKAQTPYPQYIAYLSDKHYYDNHDTLANRVIEALPEFSVDEIQTVFFRRKGELLAEVWVFLRLNNN